MKYCVKCGFQNEDSAKFCIECGAALPIAEPTENRDYTYEPVEDSVANDSIIDTTYSYGENTSGADTSSEDKYTYTYNADTENKTSYSSVHPGITPRNIAVVIILSIVTCGIYQLYWMYKMNEEVNTLASEPAATSGGLVLLFHILTGGIYGIYWCYRMGERCDRIKGSVDGSSAILYLILTLLGFGIVTFCLIQDTINKSV